MSIPTRISASILAAQLALLLPGLSQTPQMTVDASMKTGTIQHGATGFLYGLSQPNIPSVNLIASINPRITAQKPPNGLQHPGADADKVAGSFFAGVRTRRTDLHAGYISTLPL